MRLPKHRDVASFTRDCWWPTPANVRFGGLRRLVKSICARRLHSTWARKSIQPAYRLLMPSNPVARQLQRHWPPRSRQGSWSMFSGRYVRQSTRSSTHRRQAGRSSRSAMGEDGGASRRSTRLSPTHTPLTQDEIAVRVAVAHSVPAGQDAPSDPPPRAARQQPQRDSAHLPRRRTRGLRTDKSSGASRARTDGLLHAMQALSQLSYSPRLNEV